MSIRAYCRQEQLAETAFYYWRRELARRDGGAPASPGRAASRGRAKASSGLFLPVTVGGDGGRGMLEVRLRNGRVLRAPVDVDATRLGEVAAALDGLSTEASA